MPSKRLITRRGSSVSLRAWQEACGMRTHDDAGPAVLRPDIAGNLRASGLCKTAVYGTCATRLTQAPLALRQEAPLTCACVRSSPAVPVSHVLTCGCLCIAAPQAKQPSTATKQRGTDYEVVMPTWPKAICRTCC